VFGASSVAMHGGTRMLSARYFNAENPHELLAHQEVVPSLRILGPVTISANRRDDKSIACTGINR
jgi:hypothetical protein